MLTSSSPAPALHQHSVITPTYKQLQYIHFFFLPIVFALCQSFRHSCSDWFPGFCLSLPLTTRATCVYVNKITSSVLIIPEVLCKGGVYSLKIFIEAVTKWLASVKPTHWAPFYRHYYLCSLEKTPYIFCPQKKQLGYKKYWMCSNYFHLEAVLLKPQQACILTSLFLFSNLFLHSKSYLPHFLSESLAHRFNCAILTQNHDILLNLLKFFSCKNWT